MNEIEDIDKNNRYLTGWNYGLAGKKLPSMWAKNPDCVMGWEDAQGDDYLAIVAPPKPPLDLSKNTKIKDVPGYYADGLAMEERTYPTRSQVSLRKWYQRNKKAQKYLDSVQPK